MPELVQAAPDESNKNIFSKVFTAGAFVIFLAITKLPIAVPTGLASSLIIELFSFTVPLVSVVGLDLLTP